MTKREKQLNKMQWQAQLDQMQKQAERNWIEGKKEDKQLAQRIRLAKQKLGIL